LSEEEKEEVKRTLSGEEPVMDKSEFEEYVGLQKKL